MEKKKSKFLRAAFNKFDRTGKVGDLAKWFLLPDIRNSQVMKFSIIFPDGTHLSMLCTGSKPYKAFQKKLKLAAKKRK